MEAGGTFLGKCFKAIQGCARLCDSVIILVFFTLAGA